MTCPDRSPTLLTSPRIRLVAAILAIVAFSACGDDGGGDAAPATASAESTSSVVASPTPDPLASLEADGARTLEHLRVLTEDVGPRPAGTDAEKRAVDYLKAELERYGYTVTLQDFPFDASSFLPARVDAGEYGFGALALKGSAGDIVNGTFVDAGIGRPEQFPPNTSGAIALIERGELTFAEKANNAVAAGASAVVIFNTEAGSLVGNLDGEVAIPVVGVRQTVGNDLRARITAGPLTGRVTVTPPRGTAFNVVARPAGVTTCTTVTGGHFDSVAVSPGADDNASGTAAVLEVARLAAAHKLAGANCFVLFGAEEFGLLGSAAYVERLPDAELNGMRAMINIDVVGTPPRLNLIGDDDLIELARVEGSRLGIETTPASLRDGSSSDHATFQRYDVPALMLNRFNDKIHTTADSFEAIRQQSLVDAVDVAFNTLKALNPPPAVP